MHAPEMSRHVGQSFLRLLKRLNHVQDRRIWRICMDTAGIHYDASVCQLASLMDFAKLGRMLHRRSGRHHAWPWCTTAAMHRDAHSRGRRAGHMYKSVLMDD